MNTYCEFVDDEELIVSFKRYESHALIRHGRRYYRVISHPFPFVYRGVTDEIRNPLRAVVRCGR